VHWVTRCTRWAAPRATTSAGWCGPSSVWPPSGLLWPRSA